MDQCLEIVYRPIGLVHSLYRKKTGVPIQGSLSEKSQGTAEVFAQFEAGLQDIEGFSHLILIYHMHKVDGVDLVCRHFLQDEDPGIFAVRSPRRPNPIGFSVVRLERREGRMLHISEVDIMDQTPILDIKPWVCHFDTRRDTRSGWFDEALKGVKARDADDRFGQ